MKSADMEMNVGTYCPRGESTQSYLCRGIPTYSNPAKQLFARKNNILSHAHLKYETREDKQLHKLLKNALTSQLVDTKDINVLEELNKGNSTSDSAEQHLQPLK